MANAVTIEIRLWNLIGLLVVELLTKKIGILPLIALATHQIFTKLTLARTAKQKNLTYERYTNVRKPQTAGRNRKLFSVPAENQLQLVALLMREPATGFVVIPYIQGVTEPIKKILNSHNV